MKTNKVEAKSELTDAEIMLLYTAIGDDGAREVDEYDYAETIQKVVEGFIAARLAEYKAKVLTAMPKKPNDLSKCDNYTQGYHKAIAELTRAIEAVDNER